MLSFQVGNTTFDFLPLLIIVFVVFPAIAITVGVIKTKQLNSMKTLCLSGEYERSLVLAKKLLTYFTRSYKLYRMSKIKLSIESLHIWHAISYLGLSQYDKFWEHINKVEQQKNMACGWIAIYYILQKDFGQTKHYKEMIEPTEEMKKTIALLDGILLCEEGKVDEGKALLNSLLPTLKIALMKQLVSNYVA